MALPTLEEVGPEVSALARRYGASEPLWRRLASDLFAELRRCPNLGAADAESQLCDLFDWGGRSLLARDGIRPAFAEHAEAGGTPEEWRRAAIRELALHLMRQLRAQVGTEAGTDRYVVRPLGGNIWTGFLLRQLPEIPQAELQRLAVARPETLAEFVPGGGDMEAALRKVRRVLRSAGVSAADLVTALELTER